MRARALAVVLALLAVSCGTGDRSDTVGPAGTRPKWSRVAHDEDLFGGRGDQLAFAVGAGGPGVVAVGWTQVGPDDWDAAVWTSDDGRRWQRTPADAALFGGDGFQSMRGIVDMDSTLVVVGGDGAGEGRAAVWTSTDGTRWSRAPDPDAELDGAGSQRMNAVAVGEGLAVAVGIDEVDDREVAAVWTSEDGVSWVRGDGLRAGADEQHAIGVALGGGRWVAAGWTGGITKRDAAAWWSDDGRTWTPAGTADLVGDHPSSIRALTHGASGFVAVGSASDGSDVDAAVWVSEDGERWERVEAGDAFGGEAAQEMFAVIATAGDGYVAVGRDGSEAAVWTSPDGVGWSRTVQTSLGEEDITVMRGLAAFGEGVVAGGGATVLEGNTPDDRAAFWYSSAG